MRTYKELSSFKTFDERYEYLRIPSQVGIQTFGFDRYINQEFYHSREWKSVRDKVIFRDNACDLGIQDRPIYGYVRVHHMNPISVDDFERENFALILDPEFLICVSFDTHNALHYGSKTNLLIPLVERKKGDTTLWTVSS